MVSGLLENQFNDTFVPKILSFLRKFIVVDSATSVCLKLINRMSLTIKMLKNSILKNNKYRFNIYKNQAPNIKEVNWYDLPDTLCVRLTGLKLKRVNITIKTLKKLFGKNKKINKNIKSIFNWRYSKKYNLPIKLPLNLDNTDYVRLYSLMISEGTYNLHFSIHVPEEHLHKVFKQSLNKLFGKTINNLINTIISKNIKLQLAPQIVRYFIPIPDHIPKLVLKNKEFAREYLKIAFESEGYPYVNKAKNKRCIKLTRNIGIDDLMDVRLKYEPGQRIFLRRLEKDYPRVYKKIFEKVPPTLLGESLLLSHHFNIENTIKPEALLVNKTNYRTGFYSVKWNLYIYAEPIDRFIKEINFMSKEKRKKCQEMLKFKSNKPAFFILRIMRKISKNNIFTRKKLRQEMKKLGYVSPSKYLWFYKKKGLLKRIKRGYYRLS